MTNNCYLDRIGKVDFKMNSDKLFKGVTMMAVKLTDDLMEEYAYKTRYAPTDRKDIEYPESDGEPMAETEIHRDAIIKTLQMLIAHFEDVPDVCVSGNMMMYYEEGNAKKSISPDVYVSFDVGKRRRRIYRFWDEGKPPDFIIEFSSLGTYREDLRKKVPLYAEIGIKEYFLCDLEGLYLPTPLIGYRLVDGEYESIPVDANGNAFSETLGLELRLHDEDIDFYDPETDKLLLTPTEAAQLEAEQAQLEAEQAQLEAEQAQSLAEQESIARQRAEEEVAQLREEIERLNSLTNSA